MFERVFKKLMIFALVCLSCHVIGIPEDIGNEDLAIINASQQLIVVTSDKWSTAKGHLERFERKDTQSQWQNLGEVIPVALGSAGMGWGTLYLQDFIGPRKHEKDNRTPAGVFTIAQAFGFSRAAPVSTKLIYMPITANTLCVDDQNSLFYNKIVEADKILQPDWSSAEKMHEISLYEQGLVIRYNNRKPVPGAGSCIFMHNWRNPNEGTNGCVALAASDLTVLISWLDPNKKPVLVVLPKKEYQLLAKSWNLPELG